MNCKECQDARKVVNRKDSDKVGCSLALNVSRVEEEVIATNTEHKYGYMYVNAPPDSDEKGLMVVGMLVPHDYICRVRTQITDEH